MTEQNYTIGLDIGQRRDPTALVVAEAVPTLTGRAIHARDCGAPGGDLRPLAVLLGGVSITGGSGWSWG